MKRLLVIAAVAFLITGCKTGSGSSNESPSSGMSATTVTNEGQTMYSDLNLTSVSGSPSAASAVIPEPATLALFGMGAAGMALCKLRRKK